MSYGATVADAVHRTGVYAGKILSGAKAADLPVIAPTRFESAPAISRKVR
jgi:putative ABC transport system substrate-binding protein